MTGPHDLSGTEGPDGPEVAGTEEAAGELPGRLGVGVPSGPGWEEFGRLVATVRALGEEVGEEVGELRGVVEDLAAEATAQAELTRPWDWTGMTAAQAEQRWPVLGAWVAEFVHRHALTGWVPSCWAEHRYLVEELAVLRQVWVAAYTGPAASPDAALGWLEALERFRARIQDRDKGRCRGGHTSPAGSSPAGTYPGWDEEAWQEAFTDTARRDVDARRAAEPAPTGDALTLDDALTDHADTTPPPTGRSVAGDDGNGGRGQDGPDVVVLP